MRSKFDSRRRTRSKAQASQEALSQAELEKKGEVALNSKAKPKRKHAVKFCPKCGSDQVFWAQGLPQLWSLWQCSNCGYRGPVILEDGEMAQKLLEKWKKDKNAIP
jgi:transcription factor S